MINRFIAFLIFLLVLVNCNQKSKVEIYADQYCDCVSKYKKTDSLKMALMICNYKMSQKNDLHLKLWYLLHHNKALNFHYIMNENVDLDDYVKFIQSYTVALDKKCNCGMVQ